MELPTNRADYSLEIEIIDPDTGEVRKERVHNELGQEIPDPVPMAPPLGYTKPLSMFDQMRAQIRAEHHRLKQLELEELAETPDQANDFEVDEDVENMPSLYEEKFDPVDFEVRSRLRQAEFRASVAARVDGLPDPAKELLNGDSLRKSEDDGRRETGGRERVRKSDAKPKGDSEPGEERANRGNVQERIGESGGSDE